MSRYPRIPGLSCLILILLYPAVIRGEQKSIHHYVHDLWTVRDGLPQNNVHVIHQTQDGFLWVGTEEGMARFDGKYFTIVDHDDTGLRKDDILAIHEGQNEVLWIGTHRGLFQLSGGNITRIPIFESIPVYAILEDRAGTLWIGNENGVYIRQDGHFQPYPDDFHPPRSPVISIRQDGTGRIWFLARSGNLYYQNDNDLSRHSRQDFRIAGDSIRVIGDDGKGGLYAYDSRHGLCHINNHSPLLNAKNSRLEGLVMCLCTDKTGSVWVGTVGRGLYRWRDRQWDRFTSSEGLASDVIETIYQDRDGALWLGSRGGGLSCLSDRAFITYHKSDGLKDDFVLSVYEDSRERLWAGTNKGLFLFKNHRFFPFGEDILGKYVISSILTDHSGRLWVAAFGAGLFQNRNRSWTNVAMDFPGLNLLITTIIEDSQSNIWIGTSGEGVFKLAGDRLDQYTTRNGLHSDLVICLKESKSGQIWIGTKNGLSRIRRNRIESFPFEKELMDYTIYDLYEDPNQALWICTYGGGLKKWQADNLTTYTLKDGLPTDKFYSITSDKSGHFWIGTGKGIISIKKQAFAAFQSGAESNLPYHIYDEADGMKTRECISAINQQRVITAHDGSIHFATTQGLTSFNPSRVSTNIPTPVPLIDHIILNGEIHHAQDELTLEPGIKDFIIRFSIIGFYSPNHNRFRFRLEGRESDWTFGGEESERTAHYANLPPGRYRFVIQAAGKNKDWGSASDSLTFSLKPHFHQTLLFRLIAGAGLLLSAGLLIGKKIAADRNKPSRKYHTSTLSHDKLQQYKERVTQLMAQEELYKDPEINLHRIADRLSIPSAHLSQTFNVCLKQNFNQFINHYRIEAAKHLLLDERFRMLKIISLGFEVGFNSKSSFNRAFKDQVGMTPSEFRSRHQ